MRSSFQRHPASGTPTAPDDSASKSMVRSGGEKPENPRFSEEAGQPGLHAALAAVRALQGRRRSEVARKAGIKTETLADYEEGRIIPRPATLARLAAALDVPIPVLEALGDLLTAFHEILRVTRFGGSLLAGAIRSTVRLLRAVHAMLSLRIESLSKTSLTGVGLDTMSSEALPNRPDGAFPGRGPAGRARGFPAP